jgi:hypothetical protein
MTQHPQSLTHEKLLERVLRVADLLTIPAERNHSEKLSSGNTPTSAVSAEASEVESAAKPVKRHFQVK